jgi:hypothetical protein
MLPFSLYFIAAAITGFHVYTLLLLTFLGAPFYPMEAVSLLGSLGLLIAAYVSLFKPYIAARIALIACLAIWSFYGPAITKIVRTRFEHKNASLIERPLNETPQAAASIRKLAMAMANSIEGR